MDIPRALDKYDASSLPCGHKYQIILDTINRTELTLNSEEGGPETFLQATKWRSFGFFRSKVLDYRNTIAHDQVFLIALFPFEFVKDKRILIELVD